MVTSVTMYFNFLSIYCQFIYSRLELLRDIQPTRASVLPSIARHPLLQHSGVDPQLPEGNRPNDGRQVERRCAECVQTFTQARDTGSG